MAGRHDPAPDFSGAGPVEYQPAGPEPTHAIARLHASEEARILAIPGVTSVGIGHGPAGGEAIVVGVVDAGVASRLPREIGGVAVVVTVTGPVDAQRRS